MKSTLRASLVLALSAGSAISQTTHLVGPGGFVQIRDALAVAAPGDILDVLPGTYAHFTANFGVTIRAVTIGTALIEYDPAYVSGCTPSVCGVTVIAPPSGQVVNCIGLDFRPSSSGAAFTHRVLVTSGTATFDRCTMQAMSAWPLTVIGARVHLQGCTVTGLGTGSACGALQASASTVTAVRSSFTGPNTFGFPQPGVYLASSAFQGSQLQITGSPFPLGGPNVPPGLGLDAASSAWISDSTITSGGSNACPVSANGGTGRLDRCVLVPSGLGCANLPGGLVVGGDSTTPLQNGAPFLVTWLTSPNQLVAVYASPSLGHVPLPGLTDQPATIDLASAWLATVLVADPLGVATATWNMPAGLYIDTSVFVMGAGFNGTTAGSAGLRAGVPPWSTRHARRRPAPVPQRCAPCDGASSSRSSP